MKSLRTLLIAFSLMSLTLHSRPSQAAVGAMVAAPAAVVAGLYIAGTGAAVTGTVYVMEMIEGGEMAGLLTFFTLLITGPVMLLGLVVLDGEQALEFAPIEVERGKKLGLTQKELSAYNNEIDQINALAAYVDSEVSKQEKPSKEYAAQIWTEVKGEISSTAFDGLMKVNNQLVKKK